MSEDQKTLYQSCYASIDGRCSINLALKAIGGVCHARWYTLATRINFLYMSTPTPSEELYRLAWFVCNVYARLWIIAKQNWRATQAPSIAYQALKLINALPIHEQRILTPVFERGFGYWLHAEQLILGCLADDDEDVRGQAVARVFQIRQTEAAASATTSDNQRARKRGKKPPPAVRIFQLPTPLYSANHFSRMIDWAQEQITEPPLLRDLSNDELRNFESVPLARDEPSNSQFVERHIQLVTQNSTRSASPTKRDGLCRATIVSRERRSRSTTKAAFSV